MKKLWERQAHIIKPNMKSEFPRNIIFFDTETDEIKGESETELVLRLGVACFWRSSFGRHKETFEWKTFRTTDEFWTFVFDSITDKQRVYLVAHNVGFDLRVLKAFKYFKEHDIVFKKSPIFENTMAIIELQKGLKSIVILDNMNYFKSSLAKLGESVGVPKMEMPTNDDKKLEEYCKNDVLIMVEAWKKWIAFLKDNDLGNFAKTIAGQSMNAYRHRFMTHAIYVHTNKTVIDLERESYHGGRTECFYIGKLPARDYYLLDVNSMYPSVMMTFDYPSKLLKYVNSETENNLTKMLDDYCAVAKVLVDTDEPIYPVKYKNKLIFPTGVFETVLSTRELKHALHRKEISRVYEVAYYEKEHLFTDYVYYFYNKKHKYKDEGNEAFEYLCKLFLNSLYGKFGQRNEHYEYQTEIDDLQDGTLHQVDGKTGQSVKVRAINGVVEKSVGQVEGVNSFVAIASHITADARMSLWQHFNVAGRDNVFYCDTDSMITNAYGLKRCQENFAIGENLGQLSIKEHEERVIIRGNKDYILGNNEVIKGIRKDATKLSDNEYNQVRFEGLAGALRNGRLDKMFIQRINKKLSREYTKGIVLKSGIVIPFELAYQQKLL